MSRSVCLQDFLHTRFSCLVTFNYLTIKWDLFILCCVSRIGIFQWLLVLWLTFTLSWRVSLPTRITYSNASIFVLVLVSNPGLVSSLLCLLDVSNHKALYCSLAFEIRERVHIRKEMTLWKHNPNTIIVRLSEHSFSWKDFTKGPMRMKYC